MTKNVTPEDPADQFEELYDNPFNIAAYVALLDVAPNIADTLIALLESNEPITHHVRQEILAALKAGQADLPENPRQAQLCIANKGWQKPGHPLYRIKMREEKIRRAKMMIDYKIRFRTNGLDSTLQAMMGKVATPKSIFTGKPVDKRTLQNDMVFHNFMREWIYLANDLPFFIRPSNEIDLAKWQTSSEAEIDFIRWGPDKPKNWKPTVRTLNRNG